MHTYGKKIFYFALALTASLAVVIILVRASYQTDFLTPHLDESSLGSVSVSPVFSKTNPTPVALSVATGVVHLDGPRLSIPTIHVDALIVPVGITATGAMATAPRLANVGWYEYGTKIGAVGSAVIAGHIDNGLALPAVFYNLNKVKTGDDIYVKNTDGTQLHFVVTDVSDYAVVSAPVYDIFNDPSGKRLIRLITCKGVWDNLNFVYNHRTVVTAELVTS